MSQAGNTGGVVITKANHSIRFQKEYRKLTPDLQSRTDEKIKQLFQDPRPPGLEFEKLKGHSKPDIYTVHVTGNYKISFEIVGSVATLRRVATHNEIDRAP